MFKRRGKEDSIAQHIILVLLIGLLFSPVDLSRADSIERLNEAINLRGARWVAGETPLSALSEGEMAKRLGALEEFDPTAGVNGSFHLPMALPSRFDWRNTSGENYVTPVRSQGGCGSCWAFAPLAALESQILISMGWPGVNLDLSEQIVLSCSGGGNCANGGYASTASNFLRDTGTNRESCYPYTETDGFCGSACSNWQAAVYRFDTWSYVVKDGTASVDALKNAIYTTGPVVAWMKVYKDFQSYRQGIYSYTSGATTGNHFVLVVGWDDGSRAFIAKNSWGTSWGESGFFRIDYDELAGETEFGRWTYAYGNAFPPAVPNLTPYQPQGWSDKIVVSAGSGSGTDSNPLYPTDTLYVRWAVINDGTAASGGFYVALYVDGALNKTWYANPLAVNYYTYVTDYSIGTLPPGTHTIRIVADVYGGLTETNDGDNEYTKYITVQQPVGPDLTGQWITFYQTCKNSSGGMKCKLTGTLGVANVGNISAPSSAVDFYATADFVDYFFLNRVSFSSLRAGATKSVKLSYTFPTNYYLLPGTYVIAVVDPDDLIWELDEGNNYPFYGPTP